MRYFITGATGFIGERLALHLADEGHFVHALIRQKSRAANLKHPNIRLFTGDLLDKKSIQDAMQGCDFVFHLAAYARVWSKDKSRPQKINVQGTINVFDAALMHNVKKVVFTSTGGTLEPSQKDKPVSEDTPRVTDFFNAYEQTKAQAEHEAVRFTKLGLDVVSVNPTRVYGPGMISESNAMTRIIKQFNAGKWRIIPGDGTKYGNYVFVDDVVKGHLLAMEKGRPGERYIIGGENVTYNEFFKKLAVVTGKKHLLFHVPYHIMLVSGTLQYWFSQLTGMPPLITPRWIRKYLHHWAVTSEKAKNELGYVYTPLNVGLRKTVDWIYKNCE
jgi:nucleoside-diphosphate-sugar epimerase